MYVFHINDDIYSIVKIETIIMILKVYHFIFCANNITKHQMQKWFYFVRRLISNINFRQIVFN